MIYKGENILQSMHSSMPSEHDCSLKGGRLTRGTALTAETMVEENHRSTSAPPA